MSRLLRASASFILAFKFGHLGCNLLLTDFQTAFLILQAFLGNF